MSVILRRIKLGFPWLKDLVSLLKTLQYSRTGRQVYVFKDLASIPT